MAVTPATSRCPNWQNCTCDPLGGSITTYGITLTDLHWTVIKFCRDDFEAQGDAPTLRRITKVGGVPTKELYKLFPKGPAKKVALVSGLGKPTGCI